MGKLVVFLILSIPLIVVSRRTLFKPHSHGFYRWFAWEGILWLILNNYVYWFDNPLGTNQILAWICLIYSLVLLVSGLITMQKYGKQQPAREDSTLYQFEKTTNLIETGIFKYVRHPLYGSLLFLNWGIYFKNTQLDLMIVAILVSALLYVTARIEEKENITFFSEHYSDYIKRSKMFIPFLF